MGARRVHPIPTAAGIPERFSTGRGMGPRSTNPLRSNLVTKRARQRVLVVCTGNSARSIMAEALFQALGQGAVEVASAGSAPTGRVHPLALEQISRLPVDPGQFTSKSLAAVLEASADPFDLVITVCDHAARHCDPLPADTTRLHWGLPDPAAHTEMEEARSAFSACFDVLAQRIGGLLGSDLLRRGQGR
ncbi:arsenate reductase ArsC [Synechococcus sp. Lug-A]|uniref:arsenate reductase ArsC n=1 Tax=Synechococcus sp. Lug-A TaxID=2823740 RepID=UPI0028F440A5|nr:arsenate reductase ArsC [Synechococcus sp. Lug-A]